MDGKLANRIMYYLSNDTLVNDQSVDSDSRQSIVLNTLILLTVISTMLFKVAEFLVEGEASNLFIIIPNLVVMIGIHLYFRKTRNVELVANITTGFLMIAFVITHQLNHAQNFSMLLWSIPIPIYAFSQYETKRAIVVIVIFYLYIVGYMVFNIDKILNSDFGISGILNYYGAAFLASILTINLEVRRLDLISLLSKKTKDLEEIAIHDKLTGLYNRLKIDEELRKEINRSSREWQPLSVLMIDIDYFKSVNDRFGHLIGDRVLKEVAQIMLDSCRNIDTVGRWGGEEFIIICPVTNYEGAKILAEKIMSNILKTDFDTGLNLTISVGISQLKSDDTIDTLMRRTDKALYRAKENGRNRSEIED